MSYADLSEAELKAIAEQYALFEDDDNAEPLLSQVEKLPLEELLLDFPNLADKLVEPEEEGVDEEDESALITSGKTPAKGRQTAAAKKAAAKKAAAKKVAPKTSDPVVGDDRTLLKMTRNNPVYEVRGYRFTRQMPYVYVDNADVDFLIEIEGGFTVAKPSEVASFFN